jgi:tryptophan synthase alpha chain
VKSDNLCSLMTHMVAGYPDGQIDIDVARGLIDGGSSFLEVQFPFSDPSADGVPIQDACERALESGFKVDRGFDLIRRIHDLSDKPVFIMSYGSIVYARGIEKFVSEAREAGAVGLIIPDLMPGYDEGLFEAAAAMDLHVVPVIPPGIEEPRLSEILALNSAYLYASLRVGITGTRTELDESVFSFLEQLKSTGKWVCAGFGIQTNEQVRQLRDYADTLIVGSAIVKTISEAVSQEQSIYAAVRRKVEDLLGSGNSIETKTAE